MNKCKDCVHEDYCPMLDGRSCKGNRWITYKYVPKSYIAEKEWINQWEGE
jgi:hypothetical protein